MPARQGKVIGNGRDLIIGRRDRMQDIIDYTGLFILWVIFVIANIVMKKVQPETWKPYFFYTLLVALAVTVFAFLYKYPLK